MNNTYTAYLEGNYWVKAGSACGVITDTAKLTVKPLPLVSFEGLQSYYCIADPLALLTGIPSGGLFSGSIFNGNYFNPQASGTGEYLVSYTYTDANGCANTNNQKTSVSDTCSFQIPNLITPNGDGLNDQLLIQGLPNGFTLMISNRWNQIVYRKENYDNSWNGAGLSDGIYYYNLSSDKKSFKGWIHLMK